MMELIPLSSRLVQSGDDLRSLVLETLEANHQSLQSGDIVVMASKIVAFCQGRLRSVDDDASFEALIRDESDVVLAEGMMTLTMKDNILIPNAGIDQSNTPLGQAVLWPEHSFEVSDALRKQLMKTFDLTALGILISDSHCQPMRQGTSGIALGWAGFEGVQDERGAKDLFGREMRYTTVAVADNLATAANLLMGETNQRIPFVLIRGYQAQFTDRLFSKEDYFMSPHSCLYQPLYNESLLK